MINSAPCVSTLLFKIERQYTPYVLTFTMDAALCSAYAYHVHCDRVREHTRMHVEDTEYLACLERENVPITSPIIRSHQRFKRIERIPACKPSGDYVPSTPLRRMYHQVKSRFTKSDQALPNTQVSPVDPRSPHVSRRPLNRIAPRRIHFA